LKHIKIVCGLQTIKSNLQLKVIGGTTSIKNSWPWQVSLQLNYSSGLDHDCGGSIINKEVLFK
jgi:hypothetical protein